MAKENETDELDELIEDEEGFAGPAAPKPATRASLPPRNGPARGNGAVEGDAQAELARLRAENARLRATAGLEGRRDEPATVGDVLDALDAQTGLIRDEVERAVGEYGEDVCDAVAARVEERLLEPLGLTEEDDEAGTGQAGGTKAKPAGKSSKPKSRRGLRKGELFYEADGSGPYAFNGDEGDEVDDDGRRRAY